MKCLAGPIKTCSIKMFHFTVSDQIKEDKKGRTWEMKNTHKNVIKRHDGKTIQTLEQHNKMNITESKWLVLDWIQLAQDQP